MSQLQAEQKTKKRKHAAPRDHDEPSSKRSKTETAKKGVAVIDKNTAHVHAHTKAKDEHSKTELGKGKGKEKATASGEFAVTTATLALSIPPVFAADLRAGAEEMLDSLVMRYVPALQGVVLAHGGARFLESTAAIKADCPFANCRVAFDATVWSPHIGMKLVGKVNLCSPDHVSLLVHRTFNVSIPRRHIPAEHWEFEYGPAENDPEFGGTHENENADADAEVEQHAPMEGSGRWVDRLTGARLGGPDGHLEFTVIGLTIANQMLSLVGSIQPDPFSPAHADAVPATQQHATEATAVEDTVMADAVEEASDEEEDEDEDEDAFETLGRMGDEAAARKAKEDADKKARKRRRREEKAQLQAQAGRKEKEKDGDADAAQGKKKRKKTVTS